MMMIESIEMVRQVSHQFFEHEKEPMFELGVPALKRFTSYTSTALQLPEIKVSVEEEEIVLINTCEPAAAPVEEEEAPAFAFCEKTHKCGHACRGVSKERRCLPCLNTECAERVGHFEGINEDELCTICYTTELGAEACSKLSCGHVFHTNCIIQLLQHRWTTLRITFAFMSCPSCKQEIKLEGLSNPIARELGPLISLKKCVEKLALENAEKQGIL